MLGEIKKLNINDLIGLSLLILPFSLKLNIYSIIIIFLYWIFKFKLLNFIQVLKSKEFWIFSSFYLFTIFALFWTCDIQNGLSLIERRFSLFLLPLIIFSTQDKINLNRIFKYFLFSTAIAFVYSFLFAYYSYYSTGDKWTPFRYFNFTENSIGIHPGYFSMYLIISVIYTLEKSVLNNPLKNKIKWILLTIFYILSILYIGAKSSFFILILIVICYAIRFSNKKREVFFYLGGFFILLVITSYFFYSISYGFRTRVVFLLTGKYNNIQERLDIYKSIIILLNRNPLSYLFGFGTGCLLPRLLEVYKEFNLVHHFLKRLDAHNIFLKSLAEQGIIGLITTLNLFQGLRLRFFSFNIKYFLFSVSFFLFGLIEHFLDTQHGVVFFTMFNVLFYRNYLDGNK
tara:strand:- start:1699 stop:2898 length:1200 start_codon:yes stop_codon:yes gene_type:complete